MIPLLRAEMVKKRQWLSEEEIMDYYSIGQCTPGIVAVNVAIFIGNKLRGFWSGVVAAIGVALPSFLIIVVLANVLEEYMDNEYVSSAFAGIRIVVIALIIDITLSMGRIGIKDIATFAVFVVAIGLSLLMNISSVYIVVGAAALGLLIRRGNIK